jgi:hypothetical protein
MRSLCTLAAASLVALVAACGAPKPPPHTVAELAADPELLQGIMVRCTANKRLAATDIECEYARAALERVAKAEESKHVDERGAEFERQRQLRRLQEEQSKRAAERAQPGFDPYSSPVATDKSSDPRKP